MPARVASAGGAKARPGRPSPSEAGSSTCARGTRSSSLAAADGRRRWTVEGLGPVGPGPALGKDNAFVSDDGRATAWSRRAGKRMWERALVGGPGPSVAPVASGSRVYVIQPALLDAAAAGPRLYALDQATGATCWEKGFPREEVFFPVEVGGGLVFLVTTADDPAHPAAFGHLYAFDATTGVQRWRVDVATDASSADFTPRFAGDKVLLWAGDAESFVKDLVSNSERLLALDARTGEVRWSFRPKVDEEKFSFSRPLVAGGLVIYGDGNSVVGVRPPRR